MAKCFAANYFWMGILGKFLKWFLFFQNFLLFCNLVHAWDSELSCLSEQKLKFIYLLVFDFVFDIPANFQWSRNVRGHTGFFILDFCSCKLSYGSCIYSLFCLNIHCIESPSSLTFLWSCSVAGWRNPYVQTLCTEFLLIMCHYL